MAPDGRVFAIAAKEKISINNEIDLGATRSTVIWGGKSLFFGAPWCFDAYCKPATDPEDDGN
jgi:hypothetical protein